MITDLCTSLHAKLKSVVREACKRTFLFYLVETEDKSFLVRTKAVEDACASAVSASRSTGFCGMPIHWEAGLQAVLSWGSRQNTAQMPPCWLQVCRDRSSALRVKQKGSAEVSEQGSVPGAQHLLSRNKSVHDG